jgi:hypothetical protein
MITAARFPVHRLPALAAFRDDASVRVHPNETDCWVRWPEGRDDVLTALRPIDGVSFYESRASHWYPAGSRLPAPSGPPEGPGEVLAKLLFPAPFPILAPEFTGVSKLPVRIERGGPAQTASAIGCTLAELQAWGAAATSAELRAIRIAVSESKALVVGAKLPAIPGAERYWGRDMFVPLGFRIAPELPHAWIRQAIGAAVDEFAFLGEDAIEIVPRSAFEPVTRAALRMEARA